MMDIDQSPEDIAAIEADIARREAEIKRLATRQIEWIKLRASVARCKLYDEKADQLERKAKRLEKQYGIKQ